MRTEGASRGTRLKGAAALTLLALAGLALGGCGGGEDETVTVTVTTTTETVIVPATTTTETVPTTTAATTTEPAATTAPPTTSAAEVVRITVVGGKPVGGIVRETVPLGAHVVVEVDSDTVDEVHLHGYDLSVDSDAGDIVRLAFVADTPGRFEVELENLGVQLAELTVS